MNILTDDCKSSRINNHKLKQTKMIMKNSEIIQVNVKRLIKHCLLNFGITIKKIRINGESKYQPPNKILPFSCFCTVYLVY